MGMLSYARQRVANCKSQQKIFQFQDVLQSVKKDCSAVSVWTLRTLAPAFHFALVTRHLRFYGILWKLPQTFFQGLWVQLFSFWWLSLELW